MKLFTASFVLAVLGFASAAPSRRADVVVKYNGIPDPINYPFRVCIPFTVDDSRIVYSEFNEMSKCYIFSDKACRYGVVGAPIIVAPGARLPNFGNVGGVVGESAMCWRFL